MKQRTALLSLAAAALLAAACAAPPPERYGMVIRLKKEKVAYYKELHAHPWPGVLERLDRSHFRNFSIWLVPYDPDTYLLFGYFEYEGDDFEADTAAMAADGETQRWWKETAPCQAPIPSAAPGQQWVMMEEIFYHDRDRPGAERMPPPPPFEAGRAE